VVEAPRASGRVGGDTRIAERCGLTVLLTERLLQFVEKALQFLAN
jgi:hypothetical protein